MNKQIKNIFEQMGITVENIISISDKKFDVYFTLGELMKAKKFIDFIPMMFQRGFIAPQKFIDGIVRTILVEGVADIPQMHLRLFSERMKSLSFDFKTLYVFAQILDGLQRSWTLVHAMHDETYKIPKGTRVMIPGMRKREDIGGYTFIELESMYPEFYKKMVTDRKLQYSCYIDISDDEATYLFTDVLNFTNDMNFQMKRNSSTMPLARTIANAVRLNSYGAYDSGTGYYDEAYAKMVITKFDVFEYRSNSDGSKFYTYVQFGNEKLEQEEIVARCFAYFVDRPGSKDPLDKMYKNSDYNTMDHWPEFEKRFLKWSEIVKSLVMPEQVKPMIFLKGFCFYCDLIDTPTIKINTKTTFWQNFLTTWSRLLELSDYEKEQKIPKSRFNLNQNKESQTYETIHQLMEELHSNPTEWGCSIVDTKRKFKDSEVDAALLNQNYICPNCDNKIDYSNRAGGHVKMHAYGGGTDVENLIALHKGCNATDHFIGD